MGDASGAWARAAHAAAPKRAVFGGGQTLQELIAPLPLVDLGLEKAARGFWYGVHVGGRTPRPRRPPPTPLKKKHVTFAPEPQPLHRTVLQGTLQVVRDIGRECGAAARESLGLVEVRAVEEDVRRKQAMWSSH